MKTNQKILRMVELAMLAAIIVVLQQIVIPLPGGLTLSLVLIPIVVGAVMFGPAAGAILGGVFGVVVTFLVMTARAGDLSTMMWVANPLVTALICIAKGVAAGWCAGLVARAFKKREFVGIVLAAAVAPIVNTGIFLLGMLTVFREVMMTFAANIGMAGTGAVYFAVVVLVGVNFIIEFAANLILSPTIAAIVKAVRKTTG
jgi:uncharacterized membrane protein